MPILRKSAAKKKGYRTKGATILIFLLCASNLFSQERYEIEVLGEKIPFRFDSKRDVLVIEGKLLKQIPALNLPQLISLVANMNFVSRGLFQADPQMLGFNQEQIVVMVNGSPINNAQTGHHNFCLPFDIEQVERIEVLRGGYSSRYGFSGVGGLVNIVLSRQKSIKMSGGSFQTYNVSLNGNLKNIFISSGMTSTEGYLEGLDGKRFYVQGGASISLGKGYLDFWGGWLASQFGAQNFYATYPSFEKLKRFLGVVNGRYPLVSDLLFNLKFSSQYSRDDFSLERNSPELYTNNHKTYQNSLEVGIHRAKKDFSSYFGFSSLWDAIDSTGIRNGKQGLALGNRKKRLSSFLGEFSGEKGNVFFSSSLQLAFGFYHNFSSHILFGYRPAENLRVSGSFYRNFRLPTYTELYYEDPVHRANPGLKPETSLGASFSFEGKTKKTVGGIKFFYCQSADLIDWQLQPEEGIWISENLKNGKYYGADIKFSSEFKSILFQGLYTWQNALFEDHPLQKTLKYRYYFPDHNLSFLVAHSAPSFSVAGALKIEREKCTQKLRSYLNLKFEKKLGKMSFSFVILNLFNHRAEKVPALPEAPRNYSFILVYNF